MFASFNRPDFAGWSGRTRGRKRMRFILVAISTMMVASPVLARDGNLDETFSGPAPKSPVESAKVLMSGILKDPDSAQYRLIDTFPAYCKAGRQKGSRSWFGWAADIEINSKNSFGGYTGFQSFTVLYNGDTAFRAMDGANFGAYGPANGPLGLGGGAGVCKRIG